MKWSKQSIALFFSTTLFMAAIADAAVIYVNPGPGTPVQDAINGANPDDTVYLNAGEYREWITIDKSIILDGAGADLVTLRGWGRYENESEYNAHRSEYNPNIKVLSSNVEIRNLRLEEARNFAVDVYQSGSTFTGISIHDIKTDWNGSVRLYGVDGAAVYNIESFRSTRQTWYDPAGPTPGSMTDSTRGGDVVEVWQTTGSATEIHHNTSHSGNLPVYLQSANGVYVHDNTLNVRAPTTSSSYNFGFVDTTGLYVQNTSNATFSNNVVTGSGYLAVNLYGSSTGNSFTDNEFNSPVREDGPGNIFAAGNTWNDGHQNTANTGGQWYKQGDQVIVTQPVPDGSAPLAANLTVVAKDNTESPADGWFAMRSGGSLIGECIEVGCSLAPHASAALVKFYYNTADGITDPSQLEVVWWDADAAQWKLANENYLGQSYSGVNRGNLLPDLAGDLVLGDYGYYSDASNKFAWAYVDHIQVPEPGTLALLAFAGLAGMTIYAWRRRK